MNINLLDDHVKKRSRLIKTCEVSNAPRVCGTVSDQTMLGAQNNSPHGRLRTFLQSY